MENKQLGGTRKSSPLEDEMTYPLTKDEYLTLKDNLITDKFSNWEAFLFTTGVTLLISGVVIWFTGSIQEHSIKKEVDYVTVNFPQVIILIIYGALSVGSLIGFLIAKFNKER